MKAKIANIIISFSLIYIMTYSSLANNRLPDGIYEANQGGREAFSRAIRESHGAIILASYKIAPNSILPKDLSSAFQVLSTRHAACTIILEDRLTKEELRLKDNTTNKQDNLLKPFQSTKCQLIQNLPIYENLHLKIFISDDLAMISTTNYVDKLKANKEKRDFSLFMQDKKIINELRSTLTNLIDGKTIALDQNYKVQDLKESETKLTWGPFQHKSHLIEMIGLARKKLSIYQQDLQDRDIINKLQEKLAQNIEVKIIMSRYPFGKKNGNKNLPALKSLSDKGAKICLVGEQPYKANIKLHIHAKVLIVDDQIMYLGSANFYPKVLNPESNNLNLGVITKRSDYILPVLETFDADWNAHKEYDFQ